MSAMRTFCPVTQIVSPSTTQFVPPPVWHRPKLAGTAGAASDVSKRGDLDASQADAGDERRGRSVAQPPICRLVREAPFFSCGAAAFARSR